ncbi:asparagine synthase C-terminal domain-containing protein [Micromonospora humi]|uniref:Carbapenam-3-carboxylate synthase n=1 Tax=Micromonospora humi TaxID=745366 RepID=A0A1C5IBC9_9ACTN|nr:asparagine synthase C-terminal domain-containing protein [Micromonospora humi]SCG55554.1 carbapenam-3-carboxylate synthase [Micromonospora humi]
MATSRWIVVGNVDLPGLAHLAERHEVGDLTVYRAGVSGSWPSHPPVACDVRTMSLVAAPPPAPAPAAGEPPRIRIDEDGVTVSASVLNEDPVHVAVNRARGGFAYFTDPLLAPLILPALGLPVEVRDDPPAVAGDETLLRHVHRVPFGAVQETRRHRDGWTTRTTMPDDPLRHLRRPTRADGQAAGRAQLEALRGEIRRIAAGRPAAGFATLLSGGIDSGSVTMLAAAEGLPVTPYSAGTPWGDEFDDAAELCDHLGLPLTRIDLSEERILAAIPQAVRGLCVTTPEVVEVALTATALYGGTEIAAGEVVLTGYGSDLINAGLYRPFRGPDELIDQTLDSVHQTRFTNELSSRLPLAYGREVHHPFWRWPVMRVALDTAPSAKVHGGREKHHLRLAMSEHVPHQIAWRRKTAVHHGGGLQAGVAKLLTADAPGVDREAVYRACFRELVAAAADGRPDGWDPLRLYERAVAAARR